MKDKFENSKQRLIHIRQSIASIEKFLSGINEEKFVADEILHNAVLMQFMIIGEAIIHVEDSLLQKFDYPWYKVRSFRNYIAHQYFNIKISAVWGITQKDLPELKLVIDQILIKEFLID